MKFLVREPNLKIRKYMIIIYLLAMKVIDKIMNLSLNKKQKLMRRRLIELIRRRLIELMRKRFQLSTSLKKKTFLIQMRRTNKKHLLLEILKMAVSCNPLTKIRLSKTT